MIRHALNLRVVVAFAICLLPFIGNTHAAEDAGAKIDFTKQVLPILTANCAGCHGEKKGLGKLRLHTAAALVKKKAADEHFLLPGDPEKSDLYKRLVLPADNKKRMPKKADPLPKDKIELIRLWIEQGAELPGEAADTDKPEQKKSAKEAPLPQVNPADEAKIKKLTEAGAQVMPLFAESPLLQVSFALGSEPATDAELALLCEVAPQTYTLNLAGAQITDAGLETLCQINNLTQLHLENSSITDAGLAHLSGLARLNYLNLYGTGITDAGLAHLKSLKQLGKLYLWNTKVSYDAARALEKEIPGLQVNLGFNHPEVVRRRLAKSVERLGKQLEESKTSETQLQKQLESARKDRESTQTLLEQTKKELAQLNGKDGAKQAEPTDEEKKKAADKAAVEKAAAEKAAAEKAAADKAAVEKKAAAAKAAAEKAAAEKAAAEKAAAEKVAAEKAEAAKKATAAKAAAEKKAADEKAAAVKAAEAEVAKAKAAVAAAAAKLAEAEKKAAEAKK